MTSKKSNLISSSHLLKAITERCLWSSLNVRPSARRCPAGGEPSIRPTLTTIRPTNPFHNRPTLIKRLDHLFRQGALVQIRQVLLQLRCTARPRDDRIATLPLHHAMVTRPPHRHLCGRHPQPPGHRPDDVQRVKVRIVPVALAEIRALHPLRIEAAAGLVLPSVARILVRQHPAGDGAELVKGDAVVPQAGE